jgi:Holliday junction resolvase RusA-like endonuclease
MRATNGPRARLVAPVHIARVVVDVMDGLDATGVLVLPWEALAQDNHRLTPARGRLVASPGYRAAKQLAEVLLRRQWHRPTLEGPVAVHGVLYVPDARKRDAGNYRKLVTDALTGIAYADDQQVHREVWERGGIDRAHPRLELTIHALDRAPEGATK